MSDHTGPIARTDAHAGRDRWLGSALAAIGAGCLGVAALSTHWLVAMYSGVDSGTRFSLREATDCTAGDCHALSNGAMSDVLPHLSAAFAPAGLITFVACIVAAVFLAISCALALAGRRPEWPMSPTTLAFLGAAIAIISGCVFVATKPDAATLGLGWAFPVFCAGAVCGLAGSQLLARALRPIDPDLLADSFDPDDF
jgi:drug/metabolite transporter (DMT)-like permease